MAAHLHRRLLGGAVPVRHCDRSVESVLSGGAQLAGQHRQRGQQAVQGQPLAQGTRRLQQYVLGGHAQGGGGGGAHLLGIDGALMACRGAVGVCW